MFSEKLIFKFNIKESMLNHEQTVDGFLFAASQQTHLK